MRYRIPTPFVLLFLIALTIAPKAGATNANIGADASSAVAQNLMGSPPLPSLEGGGLTLSPQYGYVEVDAVGTYSINGDPYTYSGTSKGNTFGLSLSGSSQGGWGFFVYTGYSRISGDITSKNGSGTAGDGINGIQAESYAGAVAVTYRLIGSEKSTFAMGVFTGPGYIGIKSSGVLDARPTGGASTGQAKYSFNPKSIGAYSGIQLAWRLGDFLINPYFTYFASPSPVCQDMDYETVSGQINDSYFQCLGGSGTEVKKMQTNPMFVSLGLFLGYKTFRINVLSSTSTFQTLTLTNYSASIGIPL